MFKQRIFSLFIFEKSVITKDFFHKYLLLNEDVAKIWYFTLIIEYYSFKLAIVLKLSSIV